MRTLFTPNVILNKLTEKVKLKNVGCGFCISVEYKINRKFTFFDSRAVKISAFSLVLCTCKKNTDFFHYI